MNCAHVAESLNCRAPQVLLIPQEDVIDFFGYLPYPNVPPLLTEEHHMRLPAIAFEDRCDLACSGFRLRNRLMTLAQLSYFLSSLR